jgi:hypothetical protein
MRQFAEEYDNPADATDAYLDSLSVDEMREELYPHIRDRMGHMMRAVSLPAEDRQFPRGWQQSPPESIGDLSEEVFSLLDGTRVRWGQATAEQHEARAAMQRAYANRSLEDAKRHDWAAETIRTRGVTCLDDLEV